MIQFYLKTPKEKDSLIMMRIYDSQFKDGVFNYSTREHIQVSKWDFKNGRPKENSTLTKVLLGFEADASDFMRLNRRTGYARESLRDHLNKITKPQLTPVNIDVPLTMVNAWESFLINIKGTCKERTWINYDNSRQAFVTHMEEEGQTSMTPSRFDLKVYNRWLAYIRDRFAPNTRARVTKHFKRFVNSLEKEGVKISLSVKEVKYRETAGVKIALDDAILDKIHNHQFDQRLDEMRWLFLLQCNTGLRIGDLFRVMENIQGDVIKIETQKVEGINIEQPITPGVRTILEKLNYKIPDVSDQHYRSCVKEIYKAVDSESTIQIRDHKLNEFKSVLIGDEISPHDAVRTFITRCMNKGITPNTIALMTGKTVQVILKHYYVSNIETAKEEMKKKFA